MADTAALDAMVAEACSGHKEALAGLYREFHGALVGFLFGLVAAEAEDLAAEAWIDMARALPTFQGDGAEFRRLLFTIARRRAVDHGRQRQRRRTDPVDLRRLPLPAADGDPGTAVVELDASRQAIRQISELLPRPQAEVVLLRVVAGLSVAETARVVGRSANAVSVLQNRGLRRLADALGVTRAATGRDAEGASKEKERPARFRRLERWDG
jgi:RNA polymerase sigma-70 factor (ECF subfamily)